MLANMNTPVLELMHHMGHVKYSTTEKYYIDENKLAREQLKLNINGLLQQIEQSRQLLNSAVGTSEDDAKLKQFRAGVLPLLDDYNGDSE